MKIVQIVGARPQFIKLAPLSLLLRQKHHEIIIHSGQHYDHTMNAVFFADLNIPPPDINLGIGSGTHAKQTAGIMSALDDFLHDVSPDWVIVYGDTNTTLAGAITASKLGFRVAHVEAGLRSYNRAMPEEMNRVVTDHVADLLLAPTQQAIQNLQKEGLADKAVLVGDIMVDSLKMADTIVSESLSSNSENSAKNHILLTLHRAGNVDDQKQLLSILSKIDAIGKPVLFPVHPRTAKILSNVNMLQYKNIRSIEPQSYLDNIRLMKEAQIVVTDSGGMQKEAYLLKKPCVTLRTETEWTETLQTGWNVLLSPNSPDYAESIAGFKVPVSHPDLYGSEVSRKITAALEAINP